jgi:hypothetical protein
MGREGLRGTAIEHGRAVLAHPLELIHHEWGRVGEHAQKRWTGRVRLAHTRPVGRNRRQVFQIQVVGDELLDEVSERWARSRFIRRS